jgi:hypothetical protein
MFGKLVVLCCDETRSSRRKKMGDTGLNSSYVRHLRSIFPNLYRSCLIGRLRCARPGGCNGPEFLVSSKS